MFHNFLQHEPVTLGALWRTGPVGEGWGLGAGSRGGGVTPKVPRPGTLLGSDL